MSDISLHDLVTQLSEIQPILLRELLKRQVSAVSQGTITPQQILAMEILFRQQDSKMTNLSRSLGVSMATMTGIVDRLVRQNLVERHFDPNDRRSIKVRLTVKGRALLKKMVEKKHRFMLDIFSKLSADERTTYLAIIQKIKNIVLHADDSADNHK
jgi:DNA-binding MarR family transcriptional regulator